MGVKGIVPNFRSPDPAASRAFYEGVLGLEVALDLGAPRVRHRAPP
jgi:catechol 2,3-dioxygenase-like lactoylglutathione lyase family enzyme